MQPPSLYSAVSGALLFAHNVLAVNNNHGLGLVPTAGGFHRQDALSLSPINTEGDKELEEWLQAHMRMSPSALRACPELCSKTVNGRDGSGYFLLPDLARLAKCNETMLLDIAVKSNDKAAIRACTADYGNDVQSMYQLVNGKAAPCPTPNNKIITTKVQVSTGFPSEVYPGGDDSDPRFSANHVLSVARQISRHLARQRPSCARSAMQFGYSQSAAIGVFSGAELHQQGLMADVLSRFIESVEAKPISKTTVFQLCYQDTLGADYTLGIVVTSAANLHKAKDVIRLWASGKCFVSSGQQDWMETRVRIPPTAKAATTKSTTNSATAVSKLNSGLSRHHYGARAVSILLGRGECRTVTVPAGSGCLDVAQKCGISQDDLNKYNSQADFCKALVAGQKVCCTSGTLPSSIRPANGDGTCVTKEVKGGDSCGSMASKCDLDPNDFMKVNTKDNLCSNLVEGQQVCCSSGKLPDRRPKPEADGTCASYKTANGDSCASIAASRDLTVQDLEDFNKKTWGWNGCDAIWRDYRLCVSKGDPPMPESVPNAVCGPTVKGTTKPGKDTDLSTLNPCPLKACCNVWGQCGLTDDFCTASKSKTGAPGTSALRNGCVSNCGRELVKGPPPASKINVAYFEAWNHNRPCLRMDVTDIDTSKYSHIHFAFGEITRDFKVDISKVQEQFDLFKTMTGVKKIISFGGWDFSASPGTFHILREAVKPENRDTLKNNVVAFINEHKLDGVDLDWEYPGAADFPDIPTDDPHNGINYHNFLKILKSGLGTDKSVSFAAPSSYWYLRSYPVEAMARTLDYIVFMTYDLHGQWDYNSKWSSPGCDTGNCLRSHINDTETKDSLIMITKAGVPSNKVVVGVASYGRTFKMEAAGCDGPQCKFTGSPRVSNAAKGRCTDTAGYISNAEIAEIIASGKVNRQWKEAGSNLLVYNDTEWVSYMNDDTKAERARFYDSYNFAGTTDWAVDLQEFTDGSGGDGGNGEEMGNDPDFLAPCDKSYHTLEDIEKDKSSIPSHCVEQYITTIQVAIMESSIKKYDSLLRDDYDHWFDAYEGYVKHQVPAQIDAFMATEEGQKYFTCTVTEKPNCCGSCRYFCKDEGEDGGCVRFPGCDASKVSTRDIKCPSRTAEFDALSVDYIANADYKLTDKDGFFRALSEKYGIDEAWIHFGEKHMRTALNCKYAQDIHKCADENDRKYHHYPLADFNDIHVYNPKDLISKSYSKLTQMRDDFKLMSDMGVFEDDMDWGDTVDGMQLPALSVEAAIDNMQHIADKGKEVEKQYREEFILNMVLGILFLVPFVGEAAGSAGMTAARTLCRLISEAGDLGMAVYGVVHDPQNAYSAVFGYVLGKAVDRVSVGKAAGARRDMKGRDLDNLGAMKAKIGRIEDVRGCLCKL